MCIGSQPHHDRVENIALKNIGQFLLNTRCSFLLSSEYVHWTVLSKTHASLRSVIQSVIYDKMFQVYDPT